MDSDPTMKTMPISVALALGANQGDRIAALCAALVGLRSCVTVTALSPVYETPAAYVEDQPPFLNAALVGTTSLPPDELLRRMKQVECDVGRRPTFRYGPRVVDIDILFYGNLILNDPALTLPHPMMGEREFVLRPLADIVPDWRHPLLGKTTATLLKELPQHDAVLYRDGDLTL